jgi:hypothetical protein
MANNINIQNNAIFAYPSARDYDILEGLDERFCVDCQLLSVATKQPTEKKLFSDF